MVTWTGIARREHSRDGLRYPSDMTDGEWLLTAPFIPPAKSGGRRHTADMGEVLNAVLYIAASGCAWGVLSIGSHSRVPRTSSPCTCNGIKYRFRLGP